MKSGKNRYYYHKRRRLLLASNAAKDATPNKGRITEEWQDGHTVSSRYDELSQRIGVVSSLGANLKTSYTRLGQVHDMQMNDWEMTLGYNDRGQEISRSLTGDIFSSNSYDKAGRVAQHVVMSNMRRTRSMRYHWGGNDRLIAIFNEQTDKKTTFSYDQTGFLTGAQYDTERLFRMPDAIGNLYRTAKRNDRKYGAGGRLLRTEDTKYLYDDEGNLIEKVKGDGERWRYRWHANGSLKEVIRPDRKYVVFAYDALGRRIQKTYGEKTTHWVWDGNTPLHEWVEIAEKPERKAPVTTWIFDESSFRPTAKLVGYKSYSIITDYLGTPVQAYDESGKLKWESELDIYGKVRTFEGDKALIPFRYQGQYEDEETGLYYNRFRYYSPDEGIYLSQDPIGLAGGRRFYSYVSDSNVFVDPFGLTVEARSADIVISTGADASATMPSHNPPYKPNAKVAEFTTTREEIFVRVHGADNKGGSWVMRESAIRGMTPEQIKAKYSLPSTPTHVSTVVVPAGTRMRSGKVNPLAEFGGIDVNAKQFQLLQRIPDENFKKTKKLSCH